MRRRFALLASILSLGAVCHAPRPASGPTVILVSIDGFRFDLRTRAETPTLDMLAERGVTAERLIPPFPTATFPSHYTMSTGLYPEHHGIVSNTMYDPEWHAWFRISNQAGAEEPRWWEGEPIWVTAEKQGAIAATFFWPGTDVAIQNVRPTYWKRFDPSVPNEDRVDQVLEWLSLPPDRRPHLLTLYFGDVDRAAHDHAVASPQLTAAIRRIDELLARLWSGLEQQGIADSVDLIVVSDHGMTERSPDRVIFMDDYVDLSRIRVADWNPVWMASPDSAYLEIAYTILRAAHPHLTVYRRDETPAHLHFRNHRRIPDIVAIADEGWSITTRESFARRRASFTGNTHGYDNALPSMSGIFIATGPAFAQRTVVPPFDNLHLYELVCHLLGLTPAPNDGTLGAVRAVLR